MMVKVSGLDPRPHSSPSEQLTVWAIMAGMAAQGVDGHQILSTDRNKNPDNPAPLKISPRRCAHQPRDAFFALGAYHCMPWRIWPAELRAGNDDWPHHLAICRSGASWNDQVVARLKVASVIGLTISEA